LKCPAGISNCDHAIDRIEVDRPTTKVSFGSSSKKHFGVVPSMKKYNAWTRARNAEISRLNIMDFIVICVVVNNALYALEMRYSVL